MTRADWSGFYTPSTPPPPPVETLESGAEDSICLREILRAQVRHGIPRNLLLAIGLQEAGMKRKGRLTIWPWSANAEGKGRYFETASSAMDWVRRQQSAGLESVDIGCMQINLRWHPNAFTSLSDGFDPTQNVEYAARLLARLYRRTGSWGAAAGSYHSATPELMQIYLDRLERNLEVANTRIDEFRTLAAMHSGPVVIPPDAGPDTAGDARTGGVFWTAWLGGGAPAPDEDADGGGRSLYGSGRIEPILPQFSRKF